MLVSLHRRFTQLLSLSSLAADAPTSDTRPKALGACNPGANALIFPVVAKDGYAQCITLPDIVRPGDPLRLAACNETAPKAMRYWRGSILLNTCSCLEAQDTPLPLSVAAQKCHRRRDWRFNNGQLQHTRRNLCLDYTAALINNSEPLRLAPCQTPAAHQSFALVAQKDAATAYSAWAPAAASTQTTTTLPSASATTQPGMPPTGALPGAKAIWKDEFDGDVLNTSIWNTVINCHNANHELQCYTNSSDNLRVTGGLLQIQMVQEAYQGRNYTSARINTFGTFDFTYGYIESSIKMPCGTGLWPAFWLMPTYSVYGPWPQSGEIDVMEFLGRNPFVVTATAHFGAAGAVSSQCHLTQQSFCDDFHRFGLRWTSQNLTWFMDDVAYFSYHRPSVSSDSFKSWPFDQPFYPILNVAMGGDWPGPPDPSVRSGTMLVDYVRVYQ